VHEAKTHFSRLIDAGPCRETHVIAKGGPSLGQACSPWRVPAQAQPGVLKGPTPTRAGGVGGSVPREELHTFESSLLP